LFLGLVCALGFLEALKKLAPGYGFWLPLLLEAAAAECDNEVPVIR
jgi:hypothetical protein